MHFVARTKRQGRLSKGNNFDQKNNSLWVTIIYTVWATEIIFNYMRGKNLVTDTVDIIANYY
jgi:hypothetical protein